VALTTSGVVDAATLGQVRDALTGMPALYRALWRAAQYHFHVIGWSPHDVADVVERELRARTRGAFIVNHQAAYVFLPNIRDVHDARSTAVEEVAHGLDRLLGVVHGLEGVVTGRLPSDTVARSNQTDFRALWEQRKNRSTIPRRSRQDERELFAFAMVRTYGYADTMERDDPALYHFVTRLEMEMMAHAGPI